MSIYNTLALAQGNDIIFNIFCLLLWTTGIFKAEKQNAFQNDKNPNYSLNLSIFNVGLSAQESQQDINVVNWYYSTMFGTGYYTVGDAKVAILNVPMSYSFKTIREKKDKYGIKLLVPVSLGFHSFDFNEILDLPNSVATLSVVPGVEFEFAVTLGTHKPQSFLGFDYTRFGFAFVFGKELRGIRLVTGFPF